MNFQTVTEPSRNWSESLQRVFSREENDIWLHGIVLGESRRDQRDDRTEGKRVNIPNSRRHCFVRMTGRVPV